MAIMTDAQVPDRLVARVVGKNQFPSTALSAVPSQDVSTLHEMLDGISDTGDVPASENQRDQDS